MTAGVEPAWQILDWDSQFFGFTIARAFPVAGPHILANVVDECARHNVRCLYFLTDAADIDTIRALERQHFDFVDIRLTLLHRLVEAAPALDVSQIRLARAGDIPELERIARVSHHDSRFYTDSHFLRDRSDALYATWITRSCTEHFADVVFVAESNPTCLDGYITCSLKNPSQAQIGLLAVAPAARRRSVGRRLIQQALAWAASQGATAVITVTQARNVSAVRTYERCGFVSDQLQLWYHRWFDIGSAT